jgi:two-component system, NtrC family, response regulator AtoC
MWLFPRRRIEPMRLLIVDHDAGLRQTVTHLLHEAGYDVVAEGSPEQALRRAGAEEFDIVVSGSHFPTMDGLAFLRRYRVEGGQGLLIVMSDPSAEESVLAAVREGAYDCVRKPVSPDDVLLAVNKAAERERLRREVEALRSSLGAGVVQDLVVCESRSMRDLLELASRVARHNTPVLITGESGTGKEVLARAIHRMSPRSEGGFTVLNCATVPQQLLEVELFGHAKGAFPGANTDRAGLFELAHQGTLMLDEIVALPLDLQTKVLRVLDDGEVWRMGARDPKPVDVRLIAATAKPIEQAVDRGEFRAELLYRLNVVHLHIPPLRERPEDIPGLLTHFARQAAQRLGHTVSVTPTALAALSGHSWPGNARELRNAVERAAVLGNGPLDVKDFAINGNGNGAHSHTNGGSNGALDLKSQVEAVERQAIRKALDAAGGNRRQAAILLGISLRTLFYKMRRLPVR